MEPSLRQLRNKCSEWGFTKYEKQKQGRKAAGLKSGSCHGGPVSEDNIARQAKDEQGGTVASEASESYSGMFRYRDRRVTDLGLD